MFLGAHARWLFIGLRCELRRWLFQPPVARLTLTLEPLLFRVVVVVAVECLANAPGREKRRCNVAYVLEFVFVFVAIVCLHARFVMIC